MLIRSAKELTVYQKACELSMQVLRDPEERPPANRFPSAPRARKS